MSGFHYFSHLICYFLFVLSLMGMSAFFFAVFVSKKTLLFEATASLPALLTFHLKHLVK